MREEFQKKGWGEKKYIQVITNQKTKMIGKANPSVGTKIDFAKKRQLWKNRANTFYDSLLYAWYIIRTGIK